MKPSEDNERLMEVVIECAELAPRHLTDKAIKKLSSAINKIWMKEGMPLFVVIPVLQILLAQLCDEWHGEEVDPDDGNHSQNNHTEEE